MPEKPGLDAKEIDEETAVPLPERDAMSLVDGGIRLVPISTIPGLSPKPELSPDPDGVPLEPPTSG